MLYLSIVIGAIIVVLAVALPMVAVFLVSLASLHEESMHSLSGEAPGPGERLARRILGFHNARTAAPVAPAARRPTTSRPTPSARARTSEVRFGHASSPVSDSGKYPAKRESSPDRAGADQRERAGV